MSSSADRLCFTTRVFIKLQNAQLLNEHFYSVFCLGNGSFCNLKKKKKKLRKLTREKSKVTQIAEQKIRGNYYIQHGLDNRCLRCSAANFLKEQQRINTKTREQKSSPEMNITCAYCPKTFRTYMWLTTYHYDAHNSTVQDCYFHSHTV